MPSLRPSQSGSLGLFVPPPIHIESPRFAGSLAMLFTCVRDHKVDLRDVPLLPICEAYLAYMLADSTPNLEEAAAALTALAYLLEKKAWALLPTLEPEPEDVELRELAAPSAYQYWDAMEVMRAWSDERSRLFFRDGGLGPDPYELPYEIGEITPRLLALALTEVLTRAIPPAPPEVYRHQRSLASQMGQVLLALSHEWRTLGQLVPPMSTREDAVYWFMGLLELVRLGQASARVVGEDVEFARA